MPTFGMTGAGVRLSLGHLSRRGAFPSCGETRAMLTSSARRRRGPQTVRKTSHGYRASPTVANMSGSELTLETLRFLDFPTAAAVHRNQP